jgi:hypothetical protein
MSIVHGYCLICFETLFGFDHPVVYLYINTDVSFKQGPDLLVLNIVFLILFWTLPGSVGSKLHLPLGIRMFHGIFASRAIFHENFRYYHNFM